VVSELIGNAIRHGRTPITYDVSVDGPDLRHRRRQPC